MICPQTASSSLIQLVLEGTPIPYAAPKVTRRGHAYNPRQSEKKEARISIDHQYKGLVMIKGAVTIAIEFHFPIPRSLSKKSRKAIQNDDLRHIKKPDIDNCIKFVLDALKGIVIKDDNQVDSLWCRKKYSENPCTIIKVML